MSMEKMKKQCFKCESKLTTDPDKVSEGYAAACLNCDEDMYDFEIIKVEEKQKLLQED